MIVATEHEAQILEEVVRRTPLNRETIAILKLAVNDETTNAAADVMSWLWGTS